MKRLALFALIAMMTTPTWAADTVARLSRADGTVRVNMGDEFVNAVENTALKAGDRIMTMDDGRAIITFNDGCDLQAGPNTLITLPAVSNCAGGLVRTQNIAPGGGEAVGASESSGWRTALLIAIPVAGAAAVIINNRDDRRRPASP